MSEDMLFGYGDAMEAAGAEILAAKAFGSYQGDWWAKVRYEGRVFWVHGAYGSCSGCDALQATDGLDGHYTGEGYEGDYHTYYRLVEGCAKCAALLERMADFGRKYLTDDVFDQPSAEAEAAKYIDWDLDAKEAVEFVRANSITVEEAAHARD